MDSLFKTSFIGYAKKSVDEAVDSFNKRFQAQMEEVQNSISAANSEKIDLLARANLIPSKVEKARTSTMLLEEYQEKMHALLDELKRSVEESNKNKMKEIEVFRRDIQEQIDWLDKRIAAAQAQVDDLVKSLAFLEKSAEIIAGEGKNLQNQASAIIDRFREMDDFSGNVEAGIVKRAYAEPGGCSAKENKDTVYSQPPSVDEASPNGLRIENISNEDLARADSFMHKMRQAWAKEADRKSEPEAESGNKEKETATSELRAKLFQIIAGP